MIGFYNITNTKSELTVEEPYELKPPTPAVLCGRRQGILGQVAAGPVAKTHYLLSESLSLCPINLRLNGYVRVVGIRIDTKG